MATARKQRGSRANLAARLAAGWRRGVLILVALLVALGLWFRAPILGYARTGASFGAHVACSCRYIEGRKLADCKHDFEKGMGLVAVSDDPSSRTVTARFPLLATQRASFHEGQGCLLEPWKG